MIIMLGVFKALMEYNDLRSHHSILRTTKKLNELKTSTCFWSHQGSKVIGRSTAPDSRERQAGARPQRTAAGACAGGSLRSLVFVV